MNKFTCISILVLLNAFLQAQTFTVGDTCCNHVNVNYQMSVSSSNLLDSLQIDLDNDSSFDIVIRRRYQPQWCSSCASVNELYIETANTTMLAFETNSINCAFAGSLYPLKSLANGSIINSALNWKPAALTMAPHKPYIYYKVIATHCIAFPSLFYVGFSKKINANDTIYGWIKIQPSLDKIVDYAYALGSQVGISESEKLDPGILVYPNPTANKLFVEIENELSSEIVLNLISIDGRKIKSLRLTSKKQEIDLSEISSGIYFVEIRGEGNIVRRKIVISK